LSVSAENAASPPERSAGEIAQHLGLAASTTSEHLKELLQLHLLVARRDGKKIYYRLRNRDLVQAFHDMIASLEDHYHRGILPPASSEEA
jgi:DNA-binding transcriptional ArsR family regulator